MPLIFSYSIAIWYIEHIERQPHRAFPVDPLSSNENFFFLSENRVWTPVCPYSIAVTFSGTQFHPFQSHPVTTTAGHSGDPNILIALPVPQRPASMPLHASTFSPANSPTHRFYPHLTVRSAAVCLVDSIPFWFAALIFQFWYTKIRVPVQIPCIFIRLRIFSLLCERPMAASNDPNRLARPQRSAPDATKSICTNYIFSHISMGKLNWSSYDNWAGNIKLWVQRQE